MAGNGSTAIPAKVTGAAKTSSSISLKWVAAVVAAVCCVASVWWRCGRNEPERGRATGAASGALMPSPDRSEMEPGSFRPKRIMPPTTLTSRASVQGAKTNDLADAAMQNDPIVANWRVISIKDGLDEGITKEQLLRDDEFKLEGTPNKNVSDLSPTVTEAYFTYVFGGGLVEGIITRCARESSLDGTLRLHLTIYQGLNSDGSWGAMRIVRVAPLLSPLARTDLTDFGQCVYNNIVWDIFEPVGKLGYWSVVLEFNFKP